MTDREKEKVLHGLSSCGTDYGIQNICEVTECPYRKDKAWCVHGLAHDAEMLIAELLKAQEPVKPKWEKGYAYCGKCGYKLHWIVDQNNFCPNCGQAVRWT